jgi:hypothetical protein
MADEPETDLVEVELTINHDRKKRTRKRRAGRSKKNTSQHLTHIGEIIARGEEGGVVINYFNRSGKKVKIDRLGATDKAVQVNIF